MAITATDPPANTTPAAFKTWAQAVKNDLTTLDSATSRLWLPAPDWASSVGSPTLGLINTRMSAWQFDQTADEGITIPALFPSSWASCDVVFYWINNGAGSGDVTWRLDRRENAVDASMNVAPSIIASTSATAGAQYIVKATTVASGMAITADVLQTLRVLRIGSAGTDTLANDAALFGVSFTRAS